MESLRFLGLGHDGLRLRAYEDFRQQVFGLAIYFRGEVFGLKTCELKAKGFRARGLSGRIGLPGRLTTGPESRVCVPGPGRAISMV